MQASPQLCSSGVHMRFGEENDLGRGGAPKPAVLFGGKKDVDRFCA